MHYLVLPYFILFLLYFIFVMHRDDDVKQIGIIYFLLIAALFFLVAMLLQPLTGDNHAYSLHFEYIRNLKFSEMLSSISPEFGYKILNWLVGQVSSNYLVFSFTIFILFTTILYKSIKNIYPSFEKYFVLFMFILYPYSMAYIVSGKRQGIALVFMLLALSFFNQDKKLKGTISMIMISLFHYGSLIVIPFITIFVLFKEKNIFKLSILVFILSIFISFFGINELLLDNVSNYIILDPRYAVYFESEGAFKTINYEVGFRLKFVLFSSVPLILYLLFKDKIDEKEKKRVLNWLSVYLLLNSMYHFLSAIPFNDRFGTFSWFILPIVCYEVLRVINKQYAVLLTVIFFFIGVVLLQFYTSKYFHPLGLI